VRTDTDRSGIDWNLSISQVTLQRPYKSVGTMVSSTQAMLRKPQAKDTSRQASAKRSISQLRPVQSSDTRINTEDVELPPTSSVDQEIKSKERILALLTEKLPKDGQSQTLVEQLTLRDARLEEYQARIVALEGELKVSSGDVVAVKNRQIQSLQEEHSALAGRLEAAETAKAAVEGELRRAVSALREEKENLEIVADGLTEELEATKTKLRLKEEQTQGMRQDLVQLSKIVQEMSKLNAELNEKINEMNKDLEVKNAEHYTATVKAQHTEELEQALGAEMAKTQSMEKKTAKALEEKAKLEALEEVSRISQEALRLVEEDLATVEHPKGKSMLESVQRVRHELKKTTSVQRSVKDDPVLMKESIRELQAANSALEAQQKRLVGIETVHLDRIAALEKEVGKLRVDLSDGNQNLAKKAMLLQENLEKFRLRTEKAEELYQRTELEHQKQQVQFVNLQNKVQSLRTAKSDAKSAEERFEAVIKDLKSQISGSKSHQNSQNSGLLNREQKLKQTAAKLKALSDEVWKKETELLRKEGQRLKLEQELKGVKELLQQAQTTAKQKAAEDLAAIEEKLEGKDREISILKDMLRSSTHQVKHRDIDISRIKMKMETATQREERSMSPSTDRAGRVPGLIADLDGLFSIRERSEGGGPRIPQNVVRKRIREEALPATNAELQTLIGHKIEAVVEDLRKEARTRADALVHVKALTEKLLSQSVREALAGEATLRVSEVAERLSRLSPNTHEALQST